MLPLIISSILLYLIFKLITDEKFGYIKAETKREEREDKAFRDRANKSLPAGIHFKRDDTERKVILSALPVPLKSSIMPYGKKGKNKSDRITQSLFNQYGGKCFYCGVDVNMPPKGVCINRGNWATADHIYSRWDMRRTLSKKVVLCCLPCNWERNYNDIKAVTAGYNYDKEYNPIGDLLNGREQKVIAGPGFL